MQHAIITTAVHCPAVVLLLTSSFACTSIRVSSKNFSKSILFNRCISTPRSTLLSYSCSTPASFKPVTAIVSEHGIIIYIICNDDDLLWHRIWGYQCNCMSVWSLFAVHDVYCSVLQRHSDANKNYQDIKQYNTITIRLGRGEECI